MLDELTKITSTRFIIITHHALTMSKMDRLYGVTMPEKGISQLVSVDLQKAEELVAWSKSKSNEKFKRNINSLRNCKKKY